MVKALQALLQTWNFTQKPKGSCADRRALHEIHLQEGQLQAVSSFPRNMDTLETKDHTHIPEYWQLGAVSKMYLLHPR